jgi:hypothetical protein
MTKAKYILKTAGELAKDAIAFSGEVVAMTTPAMPRELAKWSYDRLKGDGYFEANEVDLGLNSGGVEVAEGGLLALAVLIGATNPAAELAGGVVGLCIATEGLARIYKTVEDGKYRPGLYGVIYDGIQHVSDTYNKVVESEKDKS